MALKPDFHEVASLKRDVDVEMSITTSASLPLAATDDAKIVMFRQKNDRQEHFAVILGDEDYSEPPLVTASSVLRSTTFMPSQPRKPSIAALINPPKFSISISAVLVLNDC